MSICFKSIYIYYWKIYKRANWVWNNLFFLNKTISVTHLWFYKMFYYILKSVIEKLDNLLRVNKEFLNIKTFKKFKTYD